MILPLKEMIRSCWLRVTGYGLLVNGLTYNWQPATRNRQLATSIFLLALICFSCTKNTPSEQSTQNKRPVDLVYPFLDAANSRWFFFSSACRPFGMVNLSPDTQTGGAWGSGYRYNTDTIKGFSHIHAWQLSGVSVMPVTFSNQDSALIFEDYSSKFSHEKEKAAPGYHFVELDRYGIIAELTSTTRVGFHRYQYPENSTQAVVFNLSGLLGPSEITGGMIEKISDTELSGKITNLPTIRRPKPADVYFHVRFNRPVEEIKFLTVGEDANLGNDGSKEGSDISRALVTFESSPEPLLMKVGISYTSSEGALKNMESELSHWDFDKVVEDAQAEWNGLLSRIEIEGGTTETRKRFYTDLWHALQGRRIISDADGKYTDNTGEKTVIKQLPLAENGKPKFNHFNSDSFWGAQWTITTLWHLVYPEISEQFVNSMLQYYKDGGLIPRGPSGGNYTFVMTGASSTPFIVSAWMKGIRNFDIQLAYEGLKKNHLPGGIMSKAGYEHKTATGGGLNHYIEKGYVPYPLPEGEDFGFHQDGAGMTLEYAYQDWTLAQLAKELGYEDDYKYFKERSRNYRNLYDKEKGWIRPKDTDGKWLNPFDPYQYQHGFVESNAAQATWFVPHDLEGLADLMGGKGNMVEKLQRSFEEAEKLGFTSGTAHAKELHPEYSRIPINYGNQPSMQTAFIFNHLGRSDLTQYWGRRVTENVYSGLSPETGYNGDEDQGLMGSLAVLMKIGLFQMTGGTEKVAFYEIGSPVFDKVTIALHPKYYPGQKFVISTEGNNEKNVYIENVMLNDESLEESEMRISHSDIANGGQLILKMTDVPPAR